MNRPIAFAIACLMMPCAVPLNAQERASGPLLEGQAFHDQMQTHVGFAWSAEPLRTKLNTLSQHVRIAIWLDRRIDPSQEPELSITEMPFERGLAELASRLDAGIGIVGSVVYLGPKATAEKIATLAELRQADVSSLPVAARPRWTARQAWHWDELSTPRELLDELAQDHGIVLLDADRIPHDLWAAGEFPPLVLTERLTLLLAGFDLTFQIDRDGKQIRFVPMPEAPRITRSYPVSGDVNRWLSSFRRTASQSQIKREGQRIVVSGRAEEHLALSRLVAGEKPRTPTGPGRTVYTMKGPSMLGTVLRTLEKQAELKISLDQAAQSKLRERVSFDVEEKSLDQLIAEVLKETGLQYELDGKNLRVFGRE